jgi:renalase
MAGHSPRLAIVGTGITGSVVFNLLKDKIPGIVLLDKARGTGGRFNTHRSPKDCSHADLGAQYITLSPEDTYKTNALVAAGILKSFNLPVVGARGDHETQNHFTAPHGLSAVPKFFLGEALDSNSSHAIHFNKKVVSIDKVSKDQWRLTSLDGEHLDVHSVIITMPLPQMLELQGSISELLEPYKNAFAKVQYSRRFAMSLHYKPEDWTAFSGIPWAGKYVKADEDDVLVWISIDPRKCQISPENEGQDGNEGIVPVIVLHSSVPWGIKHFDDDDNAVQQSMQASLAKLVPQLPAPEEVKLIRWHYSQCRKPLQTGAIASIFGESAAADGGEDVLALELSPSLVAAGDGFAGSNFGNCIRSAERAAKLVEQSLSCSTEGGEGAKGGACL